MINVDRQIIGRCGEDLAASAYAALGFSCVARRWRNAAGELDLVLRCGEVLVFCEVKTRRGTACGRPEESVTAARVQRIRKVARSFLGDHPVAGVAEYRFDVAAVEVNEALGEIRVRLLRGVF